MNNTKVIAKFDLNHPDVTDYMRERLRRLYPQLVSNAGHLIVAVGGNREKSQSLAQAISQIQEMVDESANPPAPEIHVLVDTVPPWVREKQIKKEQAVKRARNERNRLDSVHL